MPYYVYGQTKNWDGANELDERIKPVKIKAKNRERADKKINQRSTDSIGRRWKFIREEK